MEMHMYTNSSQLSTGIAEWMVEYIAATLKKQDRFTLVLSGGSTPHQLNTLLAAPPYRDNIDWTRLHIFWGDERFVPFEDDRNNAKMAFDTLLNHVPVPPAQIHIIPTDIQPEAAVAAYEKILQQYFPVAFPARPSFDLVLLGMGDDGHTLSLFPYTHVMHLEEERVTSLFLKQQDMYRITLTPVIVNQANCVAFLVSGSGKAPALKEVIEGDYRPDKYPAQVIKPANENLHWFVDEAAAGLLS